MQTPEVRRLKELERENTEFKKMIAEQALDIRILKDVNANKGEPGGATHDGGVSGGSLWGE